MKPFSEVPIGGLFWHAGECWQRIEPEGLWNAVTSWREDDKTRWGQFEDDELVS